MSKFFSSPQMHARWQHRRGGVAHFYFLMLSPNLWSKIFPFTKRSGLRIFSMGGGGVAHFYFLMLSPNLWSKIFPFTKRSGLRIFSMGGGGGLHTFTFLMLSPNLWSKIFPFTKRSGLRNGILRKLLFDRGGQCLVSLVLHSACVLVVDFTCVKSNVLCNVTLSIYTK